MKKTVTLAGKEFELMKPMHYVPMISRRSLYDCYANPSKYKQDVWVDWCTWLMDNGCYEFGVKSYSSTQFTIEGIIPKEDGTLYYLYITRDHNRAYEIV